MKFRTKLCQKVHSSLVISDPNKVLWIRFIPTSSHPRWTWAALSNAPFWFRTIQDEVASTICGMLTLPPWHPNEIKFATQCTGARKPRRPTSRTPRAQETHLTPLILVHLIFSFSERRKKKTEKTTIMS